MYMPTAVAWLSQFSSRKPALKRVVSLALPISLAIYVSLRVSTWLAVAGWLVTQSKTIPVNEKDREI